MDELLSVINYYVVDPLILKVDPDSMSSEFGSCRWSKDYSLARQFIVLWSFIYLSSLVIYYGFASITYYLFFLPEKRLIFNPKLNPDNNRAFWKQDSAQVWREIFTSTWSLCIMSGMTVPVELFTMCGYGYVYFNVSDYGIGYLLLSPILFLIFTDSLIYFIHRGLHWGPIYTLHKLHHHYKDTTPYSAFSFHPLDGYLQGLPYHLFVLFFPMHSYLYAATLLMVGMWTVNIHDRVTLNLWGVNGAAHHTIHHTKFNYNYGQYFTFWDRLMGTYLEPMDVSPYKFEGENRLIDGSRKTSAMHEAKKGQ